MSKDGPSFIRGDIVHSLGSPGDTWTIVAYQGQYQNWLVIEGRIEMKRRSLKFWDCVGLLADEDVWETVSCIGLKSLRITDPENWVKK